MNLKRIHSTQVEQFHSKPAKFNFKRQNILINLIISYLLYI